MGRENYVESITRDYYGSNLYLSFVVTLNSFKATHYNLDMLLPMDIVLVQGWNKSSICITITLS
jgi:hypothetical protein